MLTYLAYPNNATFMNAPMVFKPILDLEHQEKKTCLDRPKEDILS